MVRAVRYEAKKARNKEAVKKVGNSRKRVEKRPRRYLSLSQTLSCLAVDRESDDDRAQ